MTIEQKIDEPAAVSGRCGRWDSIISYYFESESNNRWH